MAARNDPGKAGKFQATLVTAYKACLAPNDTTLGALPLAACHPAVPDDNTCQVPSAGGGKAQAKVDPAGDVALKLQLKGVVGCDGETFQGITSVRVTTNNCVSADPDGCTVVDLTDFPITSTGSCTVTGGKCKIKTTVNTELGAGTLTAGKDTSITLNGNGLKRTTMVNGGVPGIVVKAGLGIP